MPDHDSNDPAALRGLWSLADHVTNDLRELNERMKVLEGATEKNTHRLRAGNRAFSRIYKTLYEPKDGLVSGIEVMKTEQAEVCRDIKTIKGDLRWVVKLVLAGVITAVLTLVLKGEPTRGAEAATVEARP